MLEGPPLRPGLLAGTGRSQRFIVVHLVGVVQQWPVLS